MAHTRHITLPAGFRSAGVACGIKTSGKEDMALIASDTDASAAIVTTSNQVVGAPILYDRRILPRGYGKVRGMVINAGNSNVCTGQPGLRDAETMAKSTADQLGTDPDKILVASTGIIGHRLPMRNVKNGIRNAAGKLSRRDDGPALRAIMTTDTREKSAVVQGNIGGKSITISGMAKGAGMIAPSLATMISVITTDADIAPSVLSKALRKAVTGTFNAVTIDTDTSTSDIVAVLASRQAGNRRIKASGKDFDRFTRLLNEVCGELARAIAADGEGATRLIEVHVRNARNQNDATIAAKSVADSPLFKCAVHGQDPNWGRIVMALGKSSAKIDPQRLRVRIGKTTVFSKGRGVKFDAARVSEYLGADVVNVECDLGIGSSEYTALTCDLSREYITINADYHT